MIRSERFLLVVTTLLLTPACEGGDGGSESAAESESATDGEPCTEEECGPAPGAPAQLCPDGVNYSGPGPCERNAEGMCGYGWTECPPCCEPSQIPDCPEPITCCGDGSWVCGDAMACPNETTALACDDAAICVDVGEPCIPGEGSCCDGLQCCSGIPVPEGEEFCDAVCPMSDRNKKENFQPVDVQAVLDKVSDLEISTWNYTFQDPHYRHLGPMAQDFKAAFEIGHSNEAIFQVDADGVALASVQALHAQIKALQSENAALVETVIALEKRLERLEGRE